MGAIAGVLERRGRNVSTETLRRQSEVLAHRGPQGPSIACKDPVGLVHLRDAVLPSISPGEQPLSDPSGRYTMVCNGRIFNAHEVAHDLPGAKQGGEPSSILEVMLQAYLAWGIDAFKRFNGGYACAIWDQQKQTLLLARDPFGIKQLFFHLTPESLVFGTEIKAVLADRRISRRPDSEGIANYLILNPYLFRSEHTFYERIVHLQPAQVLTVGMQSYQENTFWCLDPLQHEQYSSDEDCIESIRNLITDSVRIRMPDGDRLGAALSGGFDSSSIKTVK